MNAAKAYRKLKEVEETKLSNRLMLLRLELQKSQRKIEETEKRTASILEHQQELEARNKAKVEEMKRKAEEQQMAQQINQIARTRMAIIRRTKVKSVAESKREEAAAVISARREHYESIEAAKEETMRRALAVRNYVKTTVAVGKEARRRDALAKREAARAAFAERVQSEAEKSAAAEHKVSVMEAEELKLIKMLEATQAYQKGAYNELEGALLSSRRTVSQAQDELKATMSASMSARTHSRLRQNDADAIAVATLPPMMRKQVPAPPAEEKSGASTPRKTAQKKNTPSKKAPAPKQEEVKEEETPAESQAEQADSSEDASAQPDVEPAADGEPAPAAAAESDAAAPADEATTDSAPTEESNQEEATEATNDGE